jgi:uncharacterized protein DUF5681
LPTSENNVVTTLRGGVTRAGFLPGQSGNPGGRPKGLSRRVRELVGEDGHAIADFMFSVMTDNASRTADRLEAARWLADRGFGKAVETVDVGVKHDTWPEILTEMSGDDLDTLIAILEKYQPNRPLVSPAADNKFGVSLRPQLSEK